MVGMARLASNAPHYCALAADADQRWRCDIQQVDGFSASKSELKEFATMDDMVVRNSPEMIDEISPAAGEESGLG